eukprot:2646831-Pyramimonas_sp.AAC.2
MSSESQRQGKGWKGWFMVRAVSGVPKNRGSEGMITFYPASRRYGLRLYGARGVILEVVVVVVAAAAVAA